MKIATLSALLAVGFVAGPVTFAQEFRSQPGDATPKAPASTPEQGEDPRRHLPTQADLTEALRTVLEEDNAGLGNTMWASLVDREGIVQAVTFSGERRGDQWPGSRLISVQKAHTANAFSLPDLAVSTANLYSATQPGGTLFGLETSHPIDPDAAYQGPKRLYGTSQDPIVGQKIGGVIVFGGGLALYASTGELVGALGVSGDTSCTDHVVAWKLRDALNLDHVPAGPRTDENNNLVDDNIVFDLSDDGSGHQRSEGGWGHPSCGGDVEGIAESLPDTHPIGENGNGENGNGENGE